MKESGSGGDIDIAQPIDIGSRVLEVVLLDELTRAGIRYSLARVARINVLIRSGSDHTPARSTVPIRQTSRQRVPVNADDLVDRSLL